MTAQAPINATELKPVPVDSVDRLTFTVFVAIVLHALLILGVTFKTSLNKQPNPTLEITLATHKARQAPEKADFLAQHDQEASGTGERAKEVTTDQIAPIADSHIREVNPTPQVKAHNREPRETLQPIVTERRSRLKATVKKTSDQEEEQRELNGKDLVDTPLSAEIASLRAKLDQQRQAIARRPRIHRITSVATQASVDAEYLSKWTSKVEFVGNRNFPGEAIRQRIYGKLRLLTVLRPNGTIMNVEILQSSGHSILDEAALQIVHIASPFPPFPPEIKKDVDQLEIIRTWHFEITGLSTSASNTP